MESNKMFGILSIIIGLIFIIFPIFSSFAVSLLVGLSLVFLGLVTILSKFEAINIIVGIISIILGLLFIFNISAVSFLLGFQFYTVAIVMVLVGITGLIKSTSLSKISSLLILIMGIIGFVLGTFSFVNPIYAAVLVGITLIIEGIVIYLD